MIASKTYTRGLILISVYYEGTIFFSLLPGEGMQGLLDIRFPDVFSHGQGLLISVFTDNNAYRKLTLWQSFGPRGAFDIFSPRPMQTAVAVKDDDDDENCEEELNQSDHEVVLSTENFVSAGYEQTYCVLKEASQKKTAFRDVLFRFGNWCYGGRIRLTEATVALMDIPFVIPTIRAQQTALEYVYEAAAIPTTSPFLSCLQYIHNVVRPNIINIMAESTTILQELIDKLTKLGMDGSIRKWLESNDADGSFFEFELAANHPTLEFAKEVEVITGKSYNANGMCITYIFHESTVYVVLRSLGDGDNIPLLDSSFPVVANKGRGYILQSYPEGKTTWPALRKVSVWQTATALQKDYSSSMVQQRAQQKEVSPAINLANNNSSGSENNNSENKVSTEVVTATPSSSSAKKLSKDTDDDDDDKETVHLDATKHVNNSLTVTMTKAESKTIDENNNNNNNGVMNQRPRVAMPHHLPPLASLTTRIGLNDKQQQQQQQPAPWDATGKPTSIKNKEAK